MRFIAASVGSYLPARPGTGVDAKVERPTWAFEHDVLRDIGRAEEHLHGVAADRQPLEKVSAQIVGLHLAGSLQTEAVREDQGLS